MKFIKLSLNCNTIEEVVNTVNNNPCQGFDDWTPEQIAANYAVDAQEEAGYELTEDAFEAHLDYLSENGAEFDKSQALAIAMTAE